MAGDVPLRKYIWGRDLSGLRSVGSSPPGVAGTDGASLLTAAGGIGGLLAVWDSNDTPSDTADDLAYVYFCDANGNVTQVVDVGDLANWQLLGLTGPADWHASRLAARYEYDPYGNLTGPDTNSDGTFDSADDPGPYAARNPFRFSTKYFDDETGFCYWGYRYYWPKLGRWLNRDPIGELGGANLYAYVQNSPGAVIDPLGQYCVMGDPCGGAVFGADPCPGSGDGGRDGRWPSAPSPHRGPQLSAPQGQLAPPTGQSGNSPTRLCLHVCDMYSSYAFWGCLNGCLWGVAGKPCSNCDHAREPKEWVDHCKKACEAHRRISGLTGFPFGWAGDSSPASTSDIQKADLLAQTICARMTAGNVAYSKCLEAYKQCKLDPKRSRDSSRISRKELLNCLLKTAGAYLP